MPGITREFWESLNMDIPGKFPITFTVAGQISFRIATRNSVHMGCYPIVPEQLELARQLAHRLEQLPSVFDAKIAEADAEIDYYLDDATGRVGGAVQSSVSLLLDVERTLDESDRGCEFPL